MEYIKVNQKHYQIIELLGHGKGGYSYLVKDDIGAIFVSKQIHHEPCSYYSFENKLDAELFDYSHLNKCGYINTTNV